MRINTTIAAVGLGGLLFLVGVVLINSSIRRSINTKRSITVTGSAKQAITSDLGRISFTLSATSRTAAAAFEDLRSVSPSLQKALQKLGLTEKDWRMEAPRVNELTEWVYDGQGNGRNQLVGYRAQQGYSIEMRDVKRIESLSMKLPELISQGFDVQIGTPSYIYTELAEVKVSIQGAATQDAMRRAEQIVGATGQKLGPLINARMGVLQITAPNSNQVEDWGVNDVGTIEKEVTGVVNVTFIIE